MTTPHAIAPFGQRSLTLGQIASRTLNKQKGRRAPEEGAKTSLNKWHIFRTLTEIRESLGLSDRSLALLNALLTFFPEEELDFEDDQDPRESVRLVVFPSNRQLALRANGMAEKTIRRHLGALIGAGLIWRRDSPNGKRYARKGEGGQGTLSEAFGFDLAPLRLRVEEFVERHAEMRAERLKFQVIRERVSLARRDCAKMIELGREMALSVQWDELAAALQELATPLRKLRSLSALQDVDEGLEALRTKIFSMLSPSFADNKTINMTGNDGTIDLHITNSNTYPLESEPAKKKAGGEIESQSEEPDNAEPKKRIDTLPVGLVLEACPDVKAFAVNGEKVKSVAEFVRLVRDLRPMLGISPDAWRDAVQTMGEGAAAVSVAVILQRSEFSSEVKHVAGSKSGAIVQSVNGSPVIRSAGGYLRALTEQAKAGKLSLGPMLMALIGQRQRAKKSGLVVV
jgi:replication initiation protein RepC